MKLFNWGSKDRVNAQELSKPRVLSEKEKGEMMAGLVREVNACVDQLRNDGVLVEQVWMFGSAVKDGAVLTTDSDVDLLVVAEDKPFSYVGRGAERHIPIKAKNKVPLKELHVHVMTSEDVHRQRAASKMRGGDTFITDAYQGVRVV